MGRRASLSIHGPDRTAGLIHHVTDESATTLRVGRNLEHRRAGRLFVFSIRNLGRSAIGSDQLAEVDVTSGG